MASPAARGPLLSPRVTFVLVAVLLGLAAAVLFAPAPTGQGVVVGAGLHAPAAPAWIAGALIIGLVVTMFALKGPGRAPVWVIGLVAICLAVGTVLALVLRAFGSTSTPKNNTTLVTQPAPSCSTNPLLCQYNFPPGPSAPIIAPWYAGPALYGLIIVAIVAAVILVPRAMAMRARPPVRRGVPEDGPAAAELASALDRLRTEGTGDDARRRIIRAYGQLLAAVRDRLPEYETATPREIAVEVEIKFRISAPTARALTELFEEARYSQGRPMAADAVERAESALDRALAEARSYRERAA